METNTTPQRYYALDVLRGLTVALMILVNNPGSWSHIYPPFKHASWHGFTPTDWVFPSFLFVVGNAMSFSMRKYEMRKSSFVLKKVLKRSLSIFIIGLLLTAFPFVYRSGDEILFKNLLDLRIMGVLQRIALCYLLASIIVYFLKPVKIVSICVSILLAYWGIMYFFGTPPSPYDLETNAALKLDMFFIDKTNLYKGFGIPFDPEGLLSTVPATVNVLAGYITGKYIQSYGNSMKAVISLILSGLTILALGLIWNPFFPINKPLWTSSYVLYSIGWTLIVLAILMYITEIKKHRKWSYFFVVFGKNPLFIFVLSGLVAKILGIISFNGSSLKGWIYNNLYLNWFDNKLASLLFAISFLILMWAQGRWLDKRKIYIKV